MVHSGVMVIASDESATPTPASRGLGAVVVSQLLLRVGSAAGGLVVGSYFVQLRGQGVAVTTTLVGVLAGAGYFAELVGAPVPGAVSDRTGRRVLLIMGPVLAAAGVLLLPGASLVGAVPPLRLVVLVVGVARLI